VSEKNLQAFYNNLFIINSFSKKHLEDQRNDFQKKKKRKGFQEVRYGFIGKNSTVIFCKKYSLKSKFKL